MSSNTTNLGLLKKDPIVDGNDTFNIGTMLNDNWDKIDEAFGNIDLDIPEASLIQVGISKLSSAVDSTSETESATPKAVKIVNDSVVLHMADDIKHITSAERTAWNARKINNYGMTSGRNTYTCDMPNETAVNYYNGMTITLVFSNYNTAPSTIDINGWGAKKLFDSNGKDFGTNKLTDKPRTFTYFAGNFILQGEGGVEPVIGSISYTIPGTYSFTVPDGISRLIVRMWGAGGGGGGNTVNSYYRGGGGGGAGSYKLMSIPVNPGEIIPIVVGQGGGGGTSANITGGSGGDSSVGSHIAYGGGGGEGAKYDAWAGAGTAGVVGNKGSTYAYGTTPPAGAGAIMGPGLSTLFLLGFTGGNGFNSGGTGGGDARGGSGGGSPGDSGPGFSSNSGAQGVAGTGVYYPGGTGGRGSSISGTGQPGAATAAGMGAGGGGGGGFDPIATKGGDGKVIIHW